jgi:CheY-like chemotaxis protein
MQSSIILSDRTRVLVVDDNEAMLARAAAALTPGCVVVGSAKDGPSAIEAAVALQPDVIVLDISMPEMTGLEIVARLRELGSTAAVVFTVHDEQGGDPGGAGGQGSATS